MVEMPLSVLPDEAGDLWDKALVILTDQLVGSVSAEFG